MGEIINLKWLYEESKPISKGLPHIWDYNTYDSYILHSFKFSPKNNNPKYIYNKNIFTGSTIYDLITEKAEDSVGKIMSMNYNDGVYIDVCEKFKDLNFDTAYVAIYYLIDEKYNIIPLRLLICNKDESGNILYI